MKIYRWLVMVLAVSLPLFAAQAAPSAKDAKSKLKDALKSERQFSRLYSKLSVTQKTALLASIASLNLDDSDADGLPDILEEGENSNVCDDDSDDDGKNDGHEIEDGQNPEDPDSDDDGNNDQQEAKSKGKISLIASATEFAIGDRTWIITNATSFEKTTAGALAVGVCLEVEGHLADGGKYSADKIQKEDNCK